MEFRTTIKIEPSPWKIRYNDPAMFIGSCFAAEMGEQLEAGRMPVMINPAGAMYNPVSACNCLEMIVSNHKAGIDDLYNYKGLYLSFFHNTGFSSNDNAALIDMINRKTEASHKFLTSAKFLFITFGTARIYRLKESGMIVSNCHKLPSEYFSRELLTVEQISELWSAMLDRLHDAYPDLRICFTVSPVRHWKDGAHANQVSKSVLILAIEKLLNHSSKPSYFPSYELLLDDLRDYRFYAGDMLHPSEKAVEYIREAFMGAYFDPETIRNWEEVASIVKAAGHRLITGSPEGRVRFATIMLDRIKAIAVKIPSTDLTAEKEHFIEMLKAGSEKSI
jgi:hypothetical protein